MLDLFFAMALSAAPLTLYLPPVRNLNPFVETMEFFARETSGLHTNRAALLLRIAFRRIISFLFQPSRPSNNNSLELPQLSLQIARCSEQRACVSMPSWVLKIGSQKPTSWLCIFEGYNPTMQRQVDRLNGARFLDDPYKR